MRRSFVTPTFAVGLGVVLAAALAYSTARTVISYGRYPPVGGHSCLVIGCVTPHGPGAPASARPGLRLIAPSKAPVQPAVGPARGGAEVKFQTVRQGQTGFVEEAIVTPVGGVMPLGWQLRLTYPDAQILGVWGGTWVRVSDHIAVVEQARRGGQGLQDVGDSGSGIAVFIQVSGAPGSPAGCSFDGQPCLPG